MGIETSINHLLMYWESQGIGIIPASPEEITLQDIILPLDFEFLYSAANGMNQYYPNEMDIEGFLFYPVQELVLAKCKFRGSSLRNRENIVVFAEYLHESWWYGFEKIRSNEYIIGIIPDQETFKPITPSLAEFIEMYIADSRELYTY